MCELRNLHSLEVWWGAFGTREHGLLRVFGIRGVFARLRAPEVMRTRGAMTCTPFGVLFLALNTHLTLFRSSSPACFLLAKPVLTD